MRRLAIILAASSAVLVGCGKAPTSADVAAGRALFDQNCAPCHGPGGDVRQAQQYDAATPDLRQIAGRSADGRLPRVTLAKVIDGREMINAHGRTMPVWGEVLGGNSEETEADIRSLVAYIESIQIR